MLMRRVLVECECFSLQEKCCEYWPQETGAQVGQLVVEPIAEYNMREYILREFRLNDVQVLLQN